MKFFILVLVVVSASFFYFYRDTPLSFKKTIPLENGFLAVDFWDSMQSKQLVSTDPALTNSPIFIRIEEIYLEFCSQKKEHLYSDQNPIPKIIHFIWLGSDIPDEGWFSINSWKKYHPSWQIKIWQEDDLKNFQWSLEKSKKNFYDATTYAEKADILRLEILYQFGGIYTDTDVICLKSFYDLVSSGVQFFAGIEVNYISRITNNPLHVGTAIIGAIQGSQTIKWCLDHQIRLDEAPHEDTVSRTGPGLCSRAVIQSLIKDTEKILILPVSYFYPLPYESRKVSSDKAMTYKHPETMAIHLWRGS